MDSLFDEGLAVGLSVNWLQAAIAFCLRTLYISSVQISLGQYFSRRYLYSSTVQERRFTRKLMRFRNSDICTDMCVSQVECIKTRMDQKGKHGALLAKCATLIILT